MVEPCPGSESWPMWSLVVLGLLASIRQTALLLKEVWRFMVEPAQQRSRRRTARRRP